MRTILIALLLLFSGPAFAQNKVALVLGIDAYPRLGPEQQLRKARNDARSVANTLEGIGFDVILGLDQGREDVHRKLNQFRQLLSPGDVAFVFFSGHGIEVQQQNYLLPSDIPPLGPSDEQLLKGEAINLQLIFDLLAEKGTRVNLIVVDACRNNPLAGDAGSKGLGSSRGLARIEPPVGTFVMFSAATRQTALDRLNDQDNNPNSIFTRMLLPRLVQKDLPIQSAAKTLQTEVRDLALTVSHDQRPAYYDGIVGHFCLVGNALCHTTASIGSGEVTPDPEGSPAPDPTDAAADPPPGAAAAPPPDPKVESERRKIAGEIAFLQCTRQKTPDCYLEFIRDFPDHPRKDQVPKILQNEVETPLYQDCMSGVLVKCNLYKQLFPEGGYRPDVEKQAVALAQRSKPPEPENVVKNDPPRQAETPEVTRAPLPPEETVASLQTPPDKETEPQEAPSDLTLEDDPPRRGLRILSDTDLPGNDYDDIRDIALKECRAQCEGDPKCGAFTWVQSHRWCWLKTATGVAKDREGATSGAKADARRATEKTAEFTIRRNIDLPGGDYTEYKNADLDQCTTRCSRDARCSGFSWVVKLQSCWLKSTVGDAVQRNGIISGSRPPIRRTAPAVASSGRMMTYDKIDLVGHDYADFKDVDLSECANACARDARCRAFSWVRRKRWCWVKDGVASPSVNREMVSGVKP